VRSLANIELKLGAIAGGLIESAIALRKILFGMVVEIFFLHNANMIKQGHST